MDNLGRICAYQSRNSCSSWGLYWLVFGIITSSLCSYKDEKYKEIKICAIKQAQISSNRTSWANHWPLRSLIGKMYAWFIVYLYFFISVYFSTYIIWTEIILWPTFCLSLCYSLQPSTCMHSMIVILLKHISKALFLGLGSTLKR